MIRVVHYIGALEYGGSQAFVMEIYRKIDRSKVQFDFVTFPRQEGEIRSEIEKMGGFVYEAPKFNGRNIVEFLKWWSDFLDEHPLYKVIHIHVRSVASLCLPIIKKHKCFSIVHSHSASNGKGVQAIIKFFLQYPIRYQADYMLACSEKAGKWLFGNKATKSKKYKVVRNAVDIERFHYDEKIREDTRRNLGIDNNYVIGHVGRFARAKNHLFLLKIFREISNMREEAVLLLVGGGVLKTRVKEIAEKMGLSNRVLMVGETDEIEKYYCAMDDFVFPSKWEGLGIALIEAQICGLRCIVSDKVPKEVDLGAGLICWKSLKENAKKWANELERKGEDRKSHMEEAEQKGYNVQENAVFFEEFYYECYYSN